MFGGLFDDEPHQQVANNVPIAPPLIGQDGAPFRVPDHIARSIVRGEEVNRKAIVEADADELPDVVSCRFPIPLLRRNLSLSKNTPAALRGRIAELAATALQNEHRHKLRMLELETAVREEELVYSEQKLRLEREKLLVEKALSVVELQEEKAAAVRVQASVSAAARAPTSPCGLHQSRSPGETPTGEETGCGVCLEGERDTLVAPCGHVALCFNCAEAIRKSRNPECPFCRSKITASYRLFVI